MARQHNTVKAARPRRTCVRIHTLHPVYRRKLRYEPLEDRRLLAGVTVTTLADTIDFNDGLTSLREAIFATNLVPGADSIDFASALTAAGPATILLTQGELQITDDVTIEGHGADLLTVDASGKDTTPGVFDGKGIRVFAINGGSSSSLVNVTISGLTLTGGDLGPAQGGAIASKFANLTVRDLVLTGNASRDSGGAILSRDGNLVLDSTTVSHNAANGGGGGVLVTNGNLTVEDSTISGNTAQFGGGVYFLDGSTETNANWHLAITRSTISGNTAMREGGGVWARIRGGSLSISESYVDGNFTANRQGPIPSYGRGGGIYADLSSASTVITNSSISENLASVGGGASLRILGGQLTIDGAQISRNEARAGEGRGGGLHLSGENATPTIRNSTIDANSVSLIPSRGDGGGIFAQGNQLFVESTIISGNSATHGGGLFSASPLIIRETTIANNTAMRGGGIDSNASLEIVDSTIANNSAIDGTGGGISHRTAPLSISRSTIDGNTARFGGGININNFFQPITIDSSTLSNNSAVQAGGGLAASAASVLIVNSTVSGNIAGLDGGGIWTGNSITTIHHGTIIGNTAGRKSGGVVARTLVLDHAIVAGNHAPADQPTDIADSQVQARYSLIGSNLGTTLVEAPVDIPDANGNLIGGPVHGAIDPLLGPLADNGGPTLTHALLAGSPAINRGDLNAVDGAGSVPLFDQRGEPFDRIVNGRIDIGAFEYQEPSDLNLVVDTLADELDTDYGPGDLSLREAIALANLWPSDDTIHFDPALTAAGPATILLTQGELKITDDVSIIGLGADLLTIDASGNDPTPDVNDGAGSRLFNIDNASSSTFINVTLSGMKLTGGDVSGQGGAINTLENLSLQDVFLLDNASTGFGGALNARLTDLGTVSDPGPAHLSIVDSVIAHNHGRVARAFGGGLAVDFRSDGLFTIESTIISDNSSSSIGGGAWITIDRGTLQITDSQIVHNIAGNSGGGLSITLSQQARLELDSTSIDDNTTPSRGGGFELAVNSGASAIVSNSTISGNSASNGGGVFAQNTSGSVVDFSHLTVSGNTASGSGGGMYVFGGTIRHSTIVYNHSDHGGATGGTGGGGGIFGGAIIEHSIVAQNTVRSGNYPDILNLPGGFNIRSSIIGDNASTNLQETLPGVPDAYGNLIGGPTHGIIDPLLGPLADNGGPTLTHALLPGSPAINRGDLNAMAGAGGVPLYDQRGEPFDRIVNGRIDIGAFEYQEPSDLNLVVDTLADELDTDYGRGDLSLREAIALANLWPSDDTIHFDPALTASGPATILLTQGELKITDALTIVGLGADLLTIDASGSDPTPDVNNGDGSRIFHINDGTLEYRNVLVAGVSLTGADYFGQGGAISSSETLSIANSSIFSNSSLLGGAVFASGNLTIEQSVLSGNRASREGGAIYSSNNFAANDLTIRDSTIDGNTSRFEGGGIRKRYGSLLVERTTITGNQSLRGGGMSVADGGVQAQIVDSVIKNNFATDGTAWTGFGGGIYLVLANLTLTRSTVDGNSAGERGGGIYERESSFQIDASTISNNSAARGAGIYLEGPGTSRLSNSTVSGNQLQGLAALRIGGGIFNARAQLTIEHSTITNNVAPAGRGPGIFSMDFGLVATTHINSSIVAANVNGDVDGSAFRSLGHNLIGIGNAVASFNQPGDMVGIIDPLLGPLADNGGPTLTHALLAGSPAINRGDLNAVAGTGGVPLYDQRGEPFSRVFNGRIDIGAFEYQEPSDLNLVVDTLADELDTDYSRGDLSLREAIALANLWPSDDTIHFDPALTATNPPATIRLTLGELKITDDASILGPGAELLAIDASGSDPTPDVNDGLGSRVVSIQGDLTSPLGVFISGLTFSGGDVQGDGGGVASQYAMLTLVNVKVCENSASGSGGGLFIVDSHVNATGGAAMDNVVVTNNRASQGGGIYVYISRLATSSISNAQIEGNVADFNGGGIYALIGGSLGNATFSVVHSNLNSNYAGRGDGGGAYVQTNFQGTAFFADTAFSNNTAYYSGGGLYVVTLNRDSSTTIQGASFTRNSSGVGGGGLALRDLNDSRVDVQDIIVSENAAGWGGGVAILHQAFNTVATIQTTIHNATITKNSSQTVGGGIGFVGNNGAGVLNISATQILDNFAATDGGGMHISNRDNVRSFDSRGDNVLIRSSVIAGNVANGKGGGVATDVSVTGGSSASNLTGHAGLVFESTSVLNNSAASGGGLFANLDVSVPRGRIEFQINTSTIANNNATNGGGIFLHADSVGLPLSPTIMNSTISGNRVTSFGGGLHVETEHNSSVALNNSTVAFNRSDVVGGGIFVALGTLSMAHAVVANNTALAGREIASIVGVTLAPRFSLIGSNENSGLFESPVGSADENGNLIGGPIGGVIAPRLGPLADNGGTTLTHALLPNSPAINAGDPSAIAGANGVPFNDQRGAPFTRVYGGRIDIGAFELQPTQFVLGDFNRDGAVDSADYVVWRKQLGTNVVPGSGADANGDGLVNDADHAIWMSNVGRTNLVGTIAPEAFAAESGEPRAESQTEKEATARVAADSFIETRDSPLFNESPRSLFRRAAVSSNAGQADRALVAWLTSRSLAELDSSRSTTSRFATTDSLGIANKIDIELTATFDRAFESLGDSL